MFTQTIKKADCKTTILHKRYKDRCGWFIGVVLELHPCTWPRIWYKHEYFVTWRTKMYRRYLSKVNGVGQNAVVDFRHWPYPPCCYFNWGTQFVSMLNAKLNFGSIMSCSQNRRRGVSVCTRQCDLHQRAQKKNRLARRLIQWHHACLVPSGSSSHLLQQKIHSRIITDYLNILQHIANGPGVFCRSTTFFSFAQSAVPWQAWGSLWYQSCPYRRQMLNSRDVKTQIYIMAQLSTLQFYHASMNSFNHRCNKRFSRFLFRSRFYVFNVFLYFFHVFYF